MKKPVIYSIIVSLLIIAGAYYYFFMMQPMEDLNTMPSKVKLPMPQQVAEVTKKDETEKEPAKAEPKKEVKVEPKKEVKKEEKKEEKKIEHKEVQKPEKKAEVKTEAKTEIKETPRAEKKEAKKPRYFIIEAQYKDMEEANSVKDELLKLGYHTAKVVKKGSAGYVVLSPFTDYYEADFVRKGIESDTKRKDFKTKAVY